MSIRQIKNKLLKPVVTTQQKNDANRYHGIQNADTRSRIFYFKTRGVKNVLNDAKNYLLNTIKLKDIDMKTFKLTKSTKNATTYTITALLLSFVLIFTLGFTITTEIYAQENKYEPKLILIEEYWKEYLEYTYQDWYGKPWDPTDTAFFHNPDKEMFDINWNVGQSYEVKWAKKGFRCYFDYNIIPRNEMYEDNRLIYYTIDDILPHFEKTIEGFKKLEELFGPFKLVDRRSAYPDTTHYWVGNDTIKFDRELWIEFDNYVPAFLNYGEGEEPYRSFITYKMLDSIELINDAWFCSNVDGSFFNTSVRTKQEYIHLDVFPSVASEQITLQLPDILTILPKAIKIMDTTGGVVKLFYTGIETTQTINIPDLPSGRYFVQIDNYVGSFIVR